MKTDHTQSVHDARLWRRIVLVGLIGVVPLLVVSLILINVAYSDSASAGAFARIAPALSSGTEPAVANWDYQPTRTRQARAADR